MKTLIILIIILNYITAFGQQSDTTKVHNEETIYEYVLCEEKASFPGGNDALIGFISEHTKFPVPPRECDIQHIVYMKFEITKNGEIGQLIVFRGDEPEFNEEAIRVVKSMPKWIPAKIKGKPVNTWFIIPVKFILE